MGHPDNKGKGISIKANIEGKILDTAFRIESCDMRYDKIKEFIELYGCGFIIASFIQVNDIRVKRTIGSMILFFSNETPFKKGLTKKEFSVKVIDV